MSARSLFALGLLAAGSAATPAAGQTINWNARVDIWGLVPEKCDLEPIRISVDESDRRQIQHLRCNHPGHRLIRFAGLQNGTAIFVMEPGE